MDSVADWMQHFKHWPESAPLCVHAEGRTTAAAILLADLFDRPLHVCHVARREEIEVWSFFCAKLPIEIILSVRHPSDDTVECLGVLKIKMNSIQYAYMCFCKCIHL